MEESPQPQALEQTADPLHEASLKHRPEARIVEEAMPATVLATIAGPSYKQVVGPAGFKSYLDKLLDDSGNPTDPIERQWIEQLAWSHFSAGNLLAKAAAADSPESVTALTSAAVKLMGEHRKHGLALREYRSPVVPKQVTVVNQQNLANGNQQVAMFNGKTEAAPTDSDIELGSKQRSLSHVKFNKPFPTADSRPTEPVEAPRLNGRRAGQASRSGHCEPALEILDRPTNGHG